jgi:c-di-GMP-binding flagellar brake protein YcgR
MMYTRDAETQVELRNISQGGAAILSKLELKADEVVMLRPAQDRDEGEASSMRLLCEVRHITAEPDGQGWVVGLQFQELDGEQARQFIDYVYSKKPDIPPVSARKLASPESAA